MRAAGPPIFNTNTGKHIYYAEDNYLALPPKYLWGRPNLTTVPPFAHHRLQFAITGSLDNINKFYIVSVDTIRLCLILYDMFKILSKLCFENSSFISNNLKSLASITIFNQSPMNQKVYKENCIFAIKSWLTKSQILLLDPVLHWDFMTSVAVWLSNKNRLAFSCRY